MRKKAENFAAQAHKGQKRKNSNTDYIVHPVRVARILEDAGCPEEVICAGYLHDVVEDTSIELLDIEREFSSEVMKIVASIQKINQNPGKKESSTRSIRCVTQQKKSNT